jgi:ATP-dependent Lon protease
MMGGDSNGSHLVGHSYTYVGSTWGQIVQILIDKKCMNPIILIDEVDKVSRTEHGKEITGILTHLLDPTQNDSFQDKYFSGIDLD